jgi:hypothetical protein
MRYSWNWPIAADLGRPDECLLRLFAVLKAADPQSASSDRSGGTLWKKKWSRQIAVADHFERGTEISQ